MIELLATNDTARISLLVGIFALVGLGAFTAVNAFAQRRLQRQGLEELIGPKATAGNVANLRVQANNSAWARMANMIESRGLSLSDTKDERLRAKLKAAGYTHPSAPRVFTLVRLVLIFALPGIFILFALLSRDPPGFFKIYVFGSILGLLGLYLPNLFVTAKADRRREAIVNGFPDCLDLLLVCIEAGLGIEAAMDRVGREMSRVHPEVAFLLSTTVLHLRAGATRQEAFRRLADSSAVDEINSFSTLLIQSDKLGTSISDTLRVYAAEMREKRRMRAEEKAYRLPVLISIPLVVFMLPVMIGVLMLPATVRVVRDLLPMLSGG
ncbi:MAG: type II secretion system F family protein [Sphingomonadales bacterium]|nr:type II secretion system F family protein [Sphingomonadales bacterium]MBD3773816.1 type II secretion system F family protein [Paracoccaceae bacterium]